jgi:arylsulfatase A-like enzyme
MNTGLVFENAFTVANATDPSLTSFMTAADPHTHGVVENGWGLNQHFPVLSESLSKTGVDTFGVVSVDHLSHEHSKLGRGFDSYQTGRDYDTLYPILSRIYDTRAFNSLFSFIKDVEIADYKMKTLLRDLGVIQLHCRSGRTVTDDTVAELDRIESPFFGWVHYFDMHEPRNFDRDLVSDHGEYIASMVKTDAYISRLLSTLKKRGLREETLVILTGDHGENLGDHGYTGHGRTLYDEEIHVPLVFSHPSIKSRRIDSQVRTIDIAPTILDLFGVNQPDTFGGESLRPALAGGTLEDRDVFAMAYPEFSEAVAVRADGWKLIRNGESHEVYDLSSDPDEQTDLSDEDAYGSIVETLNESLDSWLTSTDDIQQQTIDDETKEMLEDLGYVD